MSIRNDIETQAFIELLYERSGRTNGLFTGLFQAWSKATSLKLGKMSWTELLSQAGIPDAPGYQECLEICRKKPKKQERRKGKRK